MKFNKKCTLALIILALVMGVWLFLDINTRHGGGQEVLPPNRALANRVAGAYSMIAGAISPLIAEGVTPENVTFTGAHSPGDVFGNWKRIYPNTRKVDDLFPPSEACSSSCTGPFFPVVKGDHSWYVSDWTFFPVVKRDYGWYVSDVGSSDTDNIVYLPNITPEVCKEIVANVDIETGSYGVPIDPAKLDLKTIPKQAGAPFDPSKPGVYMPEGGATTIKFQNGVSANKRTGLGTFGCFDNSVGATPPSYSFYAIVDTQ